MNIVPVILAGGVGSRLWPLSRELFPKQFIKLFADDYSLFQQTVLRAKALGDVCPIVLCNIEHHFIVVEQLRDIACDNATIIAEPLGRNTAPAAAVAALYNLQQGDDDVLLLMPADHKIDDQKAFVERVLIAAEYAENNMLSIFGVSVHCAETGYGYIQRGELLSDKDIYRVAKFVEKPDSATAEKYFTSGDYFWNSGMFVFKASTYIAELQQHAADIAENCQMSLQHAKKSDNCLTLSEEHFRQCRSDSIDYAVMENTDKAVVIAFPMNWNDLGSWDALWEVDAKDEANNVVYGETRLQDVSNSYIRAENKLLVALGIDDAIIIETEDTVLVASKDKAQAIKPIVKQLQKEKRQEVVAHYITYRPWGSFENIVESENYKVKRLTVNPGAKLSLQMHYHRAEHWVVVSGTAQITKGEETFSLQRNQSTYISPETTHRLSNPGNIPLVVIEVQTGEYLGEDDIVRFDDVYGRI